MASVTGPSDQQKRRKTAAVAIQPANALPTRTVLTRSWLREVEEGIETVQSSLATFSLSFGDAALLFARLHDDFLSAARKRQNGHYLRP